MPEQPTPEKWRRQLRISVWGTMLLVMIFGGWFGWAVRRARSQREAVSALERCDATVWYYGHSRYSTEPQAPEWLRRWLGVDFLGAVEIVTFPSPPPEDSASPKVQIALTRLANLPRLRDLELHGESAIDSGLAHIRGLTRLDDLTIEGCAQGVTDAGVAHLQGLQNLRHLILQDTKMSDAGVAHLVSLRRLEFLMIDRNPITDAGLAHLQRLPVLKVLFVGGGRQVEVQREIQTVPSDDITDAGLEHLKGLTDLGVLGIEGTGVTDHGLRHLESLRKLTALYVYGTRITDAGAKSLQRAIHGLKIYREPFSFEAPEIPPPD